MMANAMRRTMAVRRRTMPVRRRRTLKVMRGAP
jgi:hypothetical protein